MLSIFLCAAMVGKGQTGLEVSAARSVTYKLELSDSSGTFSKPTIRTLDNMPASISESSPKTKKGYTVKLQPRINADGTITSQVGITLNSDTFPQLVERTKSGKTYAILFLPVVHAVKGNESTSQYTWSKSLLVAEATGKDSLVPKPGQLLVKFTVTVDPSTGQAAPITDKPTSPIQINYKVKVYDAHQLIAAPKIRTLDGQPALVRVDAKGRAYQLTLSPTLDPQNSLSTRMDLTIDGTHALKSNVARSAGEPSYILISKTKSGKTTILAASLVFKKPTLKKDDLFVVITPKLDDPRLPNMFQSLPPVRAAGSPTPEQFVYQVTIRDSKAVVAQPVVRTLDGYKANVNTFGTLGNVAISLIPRANNDGSMLNHLDISFDGDDDSFITWVGKPGSTSYFKLWKEDSATPHVLPVASVAKAHLKPGELLVEVSGSKMAKE